MGACGRKARFAAYDGRMRLKARLKGDRVHLTGVRWSESFAVEKLDGRIDLYKKLRDRANGRFAEFHAGTVEELEAIKRELQNQAAA